MEFISIFGTKLKLTIVLYSNTTVKHWRATLMVKGIIDLYSSAIVFYNFLFEVVQSSVKVLNITQNKESKRGAYIRGSL